MRILYYRLLSFFSNTVRWAYKKRLRVLAYHGVPNEQAFSRQIQYLKKKYNIISIEDLQKHLNNKKKLPSYSLLITFDDGETNFLPNGLPVMKKYNIPGCVFVITQMIDTEEAFWWEVVRTHEKAAGENPVAIRNKINILKGLSNFERLQILKTYPKIKQQQLKLKNLYQLVKNDIFVGNHSNTHPMFDKCTLEEINIELDNSREHFEKWNLPGYSIFAYPNGNHDSRTEKALLMRNIRMAFVFDHKINSKKINPLKISRIRTNSDMIISELKVKISGLHSLLKSLK